MSLIVYKASAGSGKTYTLTRDYILLSLTGYDNGAWRRILAVTFTNKAAAEMKERVILKLSEIAENKDDELINWYSGQTGFTKAEVTQKASEILSQIIHDYGSFSVLTIDSFLQRIFRAFLYELDINYSYDLLLDSGRMIEDTARAFIFELQKDTAAFSEIMKFLEYSMSDEEKYNIQNDVTELGKELTREELYRYLPDLITFLDSPGKMERVLTNLRSAIFSYKSRIEEPANKCISIIEEHSMNADDFAGKSRGILPFLYKISKNGLTFAFNSALTKGYDKGIYHHEKSPHAAVISEKIAPLLKQLVEIFLAESKRISGLYMVYRNLHVLNLLKYLEEKRKELLINNGFFYLGDVPRVLKSVIAQGGAGMIYEKTGNRFDNIFIDEFQDTSHLQWENFLPLIENSLSQGMNCIIVGDVKQAIYRWRNGDWAILAKELKETFPKQITEENLDTNRRSYPVIIDFNNDFFGHAVEVMSDIETPEGLPQIKNLYDGYEQKKWKTGEGQSGYVQIESVFHDKKEDFTKYIAENIPEKITELWNNGCHDIAVLVRSNREISEILEAIIATSPPYPVVTEKSFRLETNPVIRFVTSLLSAIAYPDDHSCAVNSCWWYHTTIETQKNPGSVFSFHEPLHADDYFAEKGYNVQKIFRNDDTYTIVCAIAEEFQLSNTDKWQPFISAFLDAVYQFQANQGGTLQDFLKWYNNHKDDLQIQLENMKDAVKIMTIHKSKGLQFSSVIIPYAGWQFRIGEGNPLWIYSDDELLKDIPAVQIPFKNELFR